MSDPKLSDILGPIAEEADRKATEYAALKPTNGCLLATLQDDADNAKWMYDEAVRLEAEITTLRARAALAEARLAVLNKQGFIHWDGQRKLWQTFCAVGETLEECADGEIAAALMVDAMIPERGRAATGPEVPQ